MGSIAQSAVPEEMYTVLEQPIGTARHIRVITIGAGASGINLVRTLRRHVSNFEHIVYEKNAKVGGTWFENRYPGCRCDVPSHNYQFSWRTNPEWSNFFAPAEEIEEYLCKVTEDEGMSDMIKTEHEVVNAQWNEDKGIWEVVVRELKTNTEFSDHCHFLLDATGLLNKWKWPEISGLQEFQGELVHSARWPEQFDYTGKKVAVIGNGSSGIQIVPAIQSKVKELVHFVRTPTWVTPPRLQVMAMGPAAAILSEIEMDSEGNFSQKQIEKFKSDPEFYRRFVKITEQDVSNNFPIMLKDQPIQKMALEKLVQYMSYELRGDDTLSKLLIPTFPVGCRRLTPGIGYLSSLRASNVRVIGDEIAKVVPQGIVLKSGEIIELDAIICATGFDVSFTPRFPVIGRQGSNLQDLWSPGNTPRAYMSTSVPNFPNFFTLMGPNSPGGHGSIFTATEQIAKHITRILIKCQTENIKAISVSRAAIYDFYEHISAFMPRTAWSSSCRSWFKNGKEDGPVTALHAGSRVHYFHMLEGIRGEDFEYVYEGGRNRFRYLGNGFSVKELGQSDSTWYLDEPDKL